MKCMSNRGFTLLTTTGLLALVAIAALLVLETVDLDFDEISRQRRTISSREAAEGGLMELLNDQDVLANLPTLQTTDLKMAHQPASNSVFGKAHTMKGDRAFDADVQLVRVVPMLESSHSIVRALVYDVRVRARTADGGTSRIQAEVFRITAAKPGTIQPRKHAR